MKQEGKGRTGFAAIAVTVFFLGCFMSLILFGTMIYRSIADGHESSNRKRALLSYLLTVTRVNESAVDTAIGEYGPMLIVADGDSGYAARIYAADGYLVEDYGKPDGKLYPDAADQIAETDPFEIEELQDNLLEVTTSQGTVYLHIGKRGAAE